MATSVLTTMAVLMDRAIAKGWDNARSARVMQYVSRKRGYTLKYTAGTIAAHSRYRDAKHLARKVKAPAAEALKTA